MSRTLYHALTLTIFVGLALSSHGVASAQTDRADIRYETVSPRSLGMAATYRLPFRFHGMPDGSLLVTPRDDVATDRRLQSVADREVTRFLRRDDLITHVEGVRIDSPETLSKAVHSSGGRPRLRVVDRDTGVAEEWTIEAFRGLTAADQVPPPDLSPQADGMVRALLIAPTGDEKIAAAAKPSLAAVRKALEQALPLDRLEVVELVGEECDARGILRAAEEIHCRQRDSLFVYVVARSGFDSRYAIGEGFSTFEGFSVDDDGAAPDDGQFLRLREGDLLRRSLWEAMLMRNARLTVLVTDAGDDATILDDAASRYLTEALAKTKDAAEPDASDELPSRRAWAERLLGHSGRIDVSSAAPSAGEGEASTGRYGWFDPERGGWFTEALLESAELSDQAGKSGWSETLEFASRTTTKQFDQRKGILSPKRSGLSDAARARLKAEPKEVAVVRTLDVQRDATLDHVPAAEN